MNGGSESKRLKEARDHKAAWRKWGPYLSERQWGTVREDYSDSGDAWDYFSHEQSRSRAYRWGEDGLAGISDEKQQLCFALTLWNGKDPILKERLSLSAQATCHYWQLSHPSLCAIHVCVAVPEETSDAAVEFTLGSCLTKARAVCWWWRRQTSSRG